MTRHPARLVVATLVGALLAAALVVDSRAELDKQVFTSKPERLRLIVPRGWRATDQPTYPGMLLWMTRGQPDGQMVLTTESLTTERYCSWPVSCRNQAGTIAARFACTLREALINQRMNVGPVQLGPKETELAGFPSVYFDYDDGKRFLRQAVAAADNQLISLVLSTPAADARTNHLRAFDQALRTLQRLPDAVPRVTRDGSGSGSSSGSGSGSDSSPTGSNAAPSGGSGSSTPPTDNPPPTAQPVLGPCR